MLQSILAKWAGIERDRTRLSRWAMLRDERGIAGIEFALIASMLCFLILNSIDVARYAWIRMQVENAAQMGAQAVWKTCDPNKLPINPKCPGYATAVTAAIHSTSLASTVSLQITTEGFYCADSADGLRFVATADPPATCLVAGIFPGYYVEVGVAYTYSPLFTDLTVAKIFSSSMIETARVRLQ